MPSKTLTEVRLPAMITASKWSTLAATIQSKFRARGGAVPVISNGEAITIVMGWLAATPQGRISSLFPLWYQLAAIAYGWDPEHSDSLDTSRTQRDRAYPAPMLKVFWDALPAKALDDANVSSPRVDLDGRFDDPVFQGQVRAALRDDGAEAQFKIPIPGTCKDKDGVRAQKCIRKMKTWPYACLEYEKCEQAKIDDPLTGIKKGVMRPVEEMFQFALLIGAVWALIALQERPRRGRF